MNKKLPLALLLSFAFMAASAAVNRPHRLPAAADEGYRTTVFDNANSAVPFRIPALTQTRRGLLLAACDFRISKTDVGWNNRNGLWQINVVMKTSDDRGRTWSDSVCVARGNEHAADAVRTAFGDPSIVADCTSDNVLLHCVAGKTGYPHATRQNPMHAVFFRSTDGGRTWDHGTDLTEMIYGLYDNKLPNGGSADGIFLTSGKIMQSRYVRKDKFYRLYMAHPVRQRGVGRCGTFVIYSDDFGATWHSLGKPDVAPSVAQDESKVEELPDGSVLLSCRDAQGGRRFNVFTYTDELAAEGRWGREIMPENMTARQVNACNGGILVVPARRCSDGRSLYVALQSVPLSARRDSVGFFYKELAAYSDYSTDRQLGAGWIKGLRVTDATSCYSTMVRMDNDRIGLLFENNFYNEGYDIEFRSLSLAEITNGAYEILPFADRSQYMIDAALARQPMGALRQPVSASVNVPALTLWRGERAGFEVTLNADVTRPLQLQVTGSGRGKRLAAHARAGFLRTVLTDNFRGCGNPPDTLQAWAVADVIGGPAITGREGTVAKAAWCTIEVPRNMAPGRYKLRLVLREGQRVVQEQPVTVQVLDRTLPETPQFNLNFWMQPYAVSRYYGVAPWSQAHFNALRPYMQMLARAGQRKGFATLFYEPWGKQSNDKFDAMIQTTRRADGTWSYDYSVFDRWVAFLDSCGITGDINCYSMVPWDMAFDYYDEGSGTYKSLRTTTSDSEYAGLWKPFLQSFAVHLKAKGWFNRAVIAMDERSLDAMLDAWKVAQQAAPGIKMALAGNYHKELVDKIYDYCIAWNQHFSADELARRNSRGWISTTYTACPDQMPNICSNNDPAEAVYLPMYCVANGFNGFLRWAWMNWTANPMFDTRFRLFTPGDTYVVYPGNRLSRRFERMIEGVQNVEKLRVLQAEYGRKGNSKALEELNQAVATFRSATPDAAAVRSSIARMEQLLNR